MVGSGPHRFSASAILRSGWGHAKLVTNSLVLAWKRWKLDDGTMMSAAVAYYLALSLFPMLLLLTSGLGLFLKFTNLGHDAEVHLLGVVAEHCSPSLRSQIEGLLHQFEDQSIATGPLGLVASGMAAIGVFYQFERSFDKIWRIPAPVNDGVLKFAVRTVTKRLLAFVLLCCVGFSIAAVLCVNLCLGALREWMVQLHQPGIVAISILDACTTMLLNSFAFAILYRALPKRKVYWRDAFRSGLLVAIIWEVGREFLLSAMIGMRYTVAYGAMGSFIALLLWFYWGVTILLFGAEYLQVIARKRQPPYRLFRDEDTEGNESPAATDSVTSRVPRQVPRRIRRAA